MELAEPVPQASGTRDIALATADGLTLQGRWYHREGAPATVVLVHGFAANRDEPNVAQLAEELSDSGYEVLSYDARGHGGSDGASGCGSTEHLDVASATRAAKLRGLPVVIVGISMGGVAVVRHLTALTSPEALAGVAGAVLISAPARWRMRPSPLGLFTALLTRSAPGRWMASHWLGVRVVAGWRVGEAPESMLRRVRVPVAVVHGAGDRLLAVTNGQLLARAAGGSARLEVVEGMGHGPDQSCRSVVRSAVGWVLAEDKASRTAGPPPAG